MRLLLYFLPVFLALLLLMMSLDLGSQTQFDLPYHEKTQIAVRVICDLPYGPYKENDANLLDLYLPLHLRTGLPLIVWIHGGGWLSGDKSFAPFYLLTQHGFAVASINYRLSKQAKFPAQLEDCAAALRWLTANARAYDIDVSRIGVWGVSAGGHLVAMIGTARDAKGPGWLVALSQSAKNVKAVCDWCGPTDLLKIITEYKDSGLARMVLDFLPNQSKEDWARQASPITYVSKKGPAFLIMHGDSDTVVPLEQSNELSQMLKANNLDSSFVVLHGQGHNFDSSLNENRVVEFFERTLK